MVFSMVSSSNSLHVYFQGHSSETSLSVDYPAVSRHTAFRGVLERDTVRQT